MTAGDLVARLSRVYAAVGSVFEVDLSLFAPKVVESESGTYIVQDFSGGLTRAQLENLLLQVIHAIANLRDNVAKWAISRAWSSIGRHSSKLRVNSRWCTIYRMLRNTVIR